MKQFWTTWLLGGALLASLQWNVRAMFSNTSADTPGATCLLLSNPSANLYVNTELLGITPGQAGELEATCDIACVRADELESAIATRLDELRERLSDLELDVDEVRALAREISDLRRQSLDGCVESVIGVRAILTPAQVGALLDECCTTAPPKPGLDAAGARDGSPSEARPCHD